jgi:hypothetical protein
LRAAKAIKGPIKLKKGEAAALLAVHRVERETEHDDTAFGLFRSLFGSRTSSALEPLLTALALPLLLLALVSIGWVVDYVGHRRMRRHGQTLRAGSTPMAVPLSVILFGLSLWSLEAGVVFWIVYATSVAAWLLRVRIRSSAKSRL